CICSWLFIFPVLISAQAKNEIKFDALGFLDNGVVIGYERFISEQSSFQIDAQYSRGLEATPEPARIQDRIQIWRSYLSLRTVWKRQVFQLGKEQAYSGIFLVGRLFLGESDEGRIAYFERYQRDLEQFVGDSWGIGIPLGVKLKLLGERIMLEPEFNQAIFVTKKQADSNKIQAFAEFFPRINFGVRF
ncbi:MAG: hypothetical protein AAFO82_20965, partial [Bacteroidota bacterium]